LWLGLCAAASGSEASLLRRPRRFVVYYGREADAALGGYDVAVLDAEADEALLARRAPGATFLGYISIGEIHESRPYFHEAMEAGLLLDPHPSWSGAWFVDLRSPYWSDLLLNRVVPELRQRGFDGVFLDTLDDAELLEARDPHRFAGTVPAAAELVRDLRRRFPSMPIMINRGYAVLPQIAGEFDMLLGESVRATHSASGTYTLVTDADYAWQRERMLAARRRDPALRIFSLDYWDPEDSVGIARLYLAQRRNGFIPYVATPDLTRIVLPPSGRTP
jgi:uncharacterized protein (TIGR01370 family)